MAREKLGEFPNSDLLAYDVAGVLEGILTLMPEGREEDAVALQEEIFALYERAGRSADPEVRGWANYVLISRCMAKGELERVEELLADLPDTHRGKPDMKAALRREQRRTEEAWVILEGDGPAALAALERMLQSLTIPWDLSVSPLYLHIPSKEVSGEFWKLMSQSLLDELERAPKCAFLREMPEYRALMGRYRPNFGEK